MIIGVDIDGVLANFNAAYARRLGHVTGRWLCPTFADDEQPPCWFWAKTYGYTEDEDREVWNDITTDPSFWASLTPYPWTRAMLQHLNRLWADVYFITTRPGVQAKRQTERWLTAQGLNHPTVLISDDKGRIAQGLKLTHFLDDRPENCAAVKVARPECGVYMPRLAYNRWFTPSATKHGIVLLDHPTHFLSVISPVSLSPSVTFGQ